ncbi:hypothetical protein [Thalassotalea ganghwensis]
MRPSKVFGYSNNARIYFAFCFNLFFVFTANAIHLNVKIDSGQLTAIITDINYPQSMLEKELNSGLQNNISVSIAVNQNKKNIHNCDLSFQITYDLWDENYVVTIKKNNGLRTTKLLGSSSEILVFLNTISVNCSEVLAKITKNDVYLFQAKVLVNPVKAKRIKRIKNWIATSRGHSVDSDKNSNTQINESPSNANLNEEQSVETMSFPSQAPARPRFEKLFDKILQQYSGPDDVAYLWSSEVATLSVNLGALNDEK